MPFSFIWGPVKTTTTTIVNLFHVHHVIHFAVHVPSRRFFFNFLEMATKNSFNEREKERERCRMKKSELIIFYCTFRALSREGGEKLCNEQRKDNGNISRSVHVLFKALN
jgi:hypothetical protein